VSFTVCVKKMEIHCARTFFPHPSNSTTINHTYFSVMATIWKSTSV